MNNEKAIPPTTKAVVIPISLSRSILETELEDIIVSQMPEKRLPYCAAVQGMLDGYRATFPGLEGWWQILRNAKGEIMIVSFTEDGRITDTPNVQHTLRNDWKLLAPIRVCLYKPAG